MKQLILVIAVLLTAATGVAGEPAVTVADIPSADGVMIHATSRGDGSMVLVFVHGWSCDGSYWREQWTHFAADYRVVTIDLGGHGKSGTEREAYTMAAFGQDVAAVLEEWDLRNVVLVGHSMGGAVITEAALAAPERVVGLIGVDNFQRVGMKLGPAQIDGFASNFERDFVGTATQWVGSMFPATADSSLKATIVNDMASAPPAVGVSALRELLGWYGGTGPARLAELQVPLMTVSSKTPPTDEAALKAIIPSFQGRYLADTGHFLFQEKPAAFNALLQETLDAMFPRK